MGHIPEALRTAWCVGETQRCPRCVRRRRRWLGRRAATILALLCGVWPVAAQSPSAASLIATELPDPKKPSAPPTLDVSDFKIYSEPPRLLLNARHLRLLRRERERDTLRWQQFNALMSGKAKMSEPGFAGALYGIITAQEQPCADAATWARSANPANPSDLRQIALVLDWCRSSLSETAANALAQKIKPELIKKTAPAHVIRSRAFAALALGDTDAPAAEDWLVWAATQWWAKELAPKLQSGQDPFGSREELYGAVEFLHAVRDNFKVDLREFAPAWFNELPAMQLLSYYPAPWPEPENEYRVPYYTAAGDPDLRQAALSRSAELALVAYDTNSQPNQFLQGWLMQDRFLMRGTFGAPYELFWANPYQPGLSFTYMPDLYHAGGRLFVRSSWDEDAVWFGYSNRQGQVFQQGRREALKPGVKRAPLTLGITRVLFAPDGQRFETGWAPAPEEGEKKHYDEMAFVIDLQPNRPYQVEVDGEGIYEASTDTGGILELKFTPGFKAAVRVTGQDGR